MNHLINSENSGIPLVIINKDNYNNWLIKQSQFNQEWLTNSHYKGEGLAILPDAKGALALALFVVNDATDFFACGDLITQLPPKQYVLQAEAEHRKAICFSWLVGSYKFDRYFSKSSQDKASPCLAVNDQALVDSAIKYAQATALVRDLVNTPAADMMPINLGECAQQLAEQYQGKVNQIIGDDLLAHNYPTIHAVGRASAHAPRLIDLTWGNSKHPKITLVGKGVCFDSGGLDLKPASGMRNMKKDMGGSAHVLGLAQLIMSHNLPVNLRVLIPAVENAVSSNALRPGDVITTRAGITVEIDNTDAEGRLVLCDALTEADADDPELIVDFATLTGAMRVALGTELPGFFSTNDQVATGITQAGDMNNDPVWRMPLYKAYRNLLKSSVADMTNCATVPFGGAITAALYLQEFVKSETNWVHFDVMAFNIRALSGRPLGGEAFGIRAVFDYLQEKYS